MRVLVFHLTETLLFSPPKIFPRSAAGYVYIVIKRSTTKLTRSVLNRSVTSKSQSAVEDKGKKRIYYIEYTLCSHVGGAGEVLVTDMHGTTLLPMCAKVRDQQ